MLVVLVLVVVFKIIMDKLVVWVERLHLDIQVQVLSML